MDVERFAARLRSHAAGSSRRGALAGLLGGVLGLVSLAPSGEKANAKKKKKPTSPQPKLAARCAVEAIGVVDLHGANLRYAQTFVPSQSGTVHQIRVAIYKGAGTTGNYVVQLVPVFNGTPAHQAFWIFAASMVNDGDVPTGASTLVANFAGTPISAGSTYAVVVVRLGGGKLAVGGVAAGTCANSSLFVASGSDPFFAASEETGSDMVFSVFVV